MEYFGEHRQAKIHTPVMIRWTGLASWEFEIPFPGSLTSTFLREGNALKIFKDFLLTMAKSQAPNLAVTVLYVPNSTDRP